MKKGLLFIISLLVFTGINAQNSLSEYGGNELAGKRTAFKTNSINKVNYTSGWFNFMSELSSLGNDVSYYRNFLFPDSTVQSEFTTGMGYVWKHSLGQVLDPVSSLYLFQTQSVSAGASYTLDSIALPYRYRRVQPGNADTLLIQVFKHSVMSFVPSPSWTTPRSYARISYDYIKRKGETPFKEIKVLLTDADTITDAQGIIEKEINVSVNKGEKIAVSFTYFPGNPYNVGDTISFYVNPLPKNQINAFVIYDSQDKTATVDNGFYNHSMMATTPVRYNISTNGWNGRYMPGVAYGNTTGNYHLDVYFKLTYEDFTGISLNPSSPEIKIYPNPADALLNIEFNSSANGIFEAEILNLHGQVVSSLVLKAKQNLNQLDVSHLENGIYFCRIKENDMVIKLSKVLVQH